MQYIVFALTVLMTASPAVSAESCAQWKAKCLKRGGGVECESKHAQCVKTGTWVEGAKFGGAIHEGLIKK